MALPFLATLSALARTAYPIIRRGVGEALSSRQILSVLRKAGLGIRRQTLLDIMRIERRVESAASQLRFLRKSFLPNPARLPTAITRIRRQYSFIVRVQGLLSGTGESVTQNITISTDTLLTRERMEKLAADVVEENSDRYGIEVQESLLVSGRKAGEAGVL